MRFRSKLVCHDLHPVSLGHLRSQTNEAKEGLEYRKNTSQNKVKAQFPGVVVQIPSTHVSSTVAFSLTGKSEPISRLHITKQLFPASLYT